MNLDLNLGPDPEPQSGSIVDEAKNLDDYIEGSFHQENLKFANKLVNHPFNFEFWEKISSRFV
jgi:hypothetical protein